MDFFADCLDTFQHFIRMHLYTCTKRNSRAPYVYSIFPLFHQHGKIKLCSWMAIVSTENIPLENHTWQGISFKSEAEDLNFPKALSLKTHGSNQCAVGALSPSKHTVHVHTYTRTHTQWTSPCLHVYLGFSILQSLVWQDISMSWALAAHLTDAPRMPARTIYQL